MAAGGDRRPALRLRWGRRGEVPVEPGAGLGAKELQRLHAASLAPTSTAGTGRFTVRHGHLPALRPGEPGRLPVLRRLRGRCRRGAAARGAQGRHASSSPTSSASRRGPSSSTRRTSARRSRPYYARAPQRARAPRRHGREVHRRRRDGALRRAGRARGRPRASRARGARDPRRDRAERATGSSSRIAVTTGEALIALGARPGRGRGRWSPATSSTPPRASRRPRRSNGILVGEATYRATRRAIEYREAEPVDGEGQGRAGPGLGGGRARGRASASTSTQRRDRALVGRERELDAARGRARARRARSGRRSSSRWSACPGSARAGSSPSSSRSSTRDPELISLAAGPLAPVRRGRHLLGARRDREGAGGHPRDATRADAAEAKLAATVDDARRRRGRARAGSSGHLRPLVGLSGGDERRRPRERGVRRLAALPRGARRAAAARARLRGPALGRRRPARLRRPPRRLGDAACRC